MGLPESTKTLNKIWEQVSRPSPDGIRRITFKNRDDLVFLYSTGFVDESKVTLLDWIAAFEDSVQKDESYLITENQWMDKVVFHYSGPIGVPFDPRGLREGEWSEEETERLFKEKLLPAVYFNEEELRAIWEEAKPTFYSQGRYLVTPGVKEDMTKLVEEYPSPAQVRALGVAEARRERLGQHTQSSGPPGAPVKAGGGFAVGPSPSQIAAQKLADILSKTGGRK